MFYEVGAQRLQISNKRKVIPSWLHEKNLWTNIKEYNTYLINTSNYIWYNIYAFIYIYMHIKYIYLHDLFYLRSLRYCLCPLDGRYALYMYIQKVLSSFNILSIYISIIHRYISSQYHNNNIIFQSNWNPLFCGLRSYTSIRTKVMMMMMNI